MRSHFHQIKKIGFRQDQLKKAPFVRQCSSHTDKPKSSPLKYLFLFGVAGAAIVFVMQNRKEEEVREIVGLNYLEDATSTPNLDISPWQIPHDEKRHKGGEDTV